MKRICEWFLIPRNKIWFKSKKNIFKYAKKYKYQLIDFYWKKELFIKHLTLSITFNPLTFDKNYQKTLNKNKKIIIVTDNWKECKYYYHFLRFYKYKVYLVK